MKLLEENIEQKPPDIYPDIWIWHQMHRKQYGQLRMCESVKVLCTKRFCQTELKRQPTEWQKTLINPISGKALISRELLKHINNNKSSIQK